jgi:hypothetical protein
MAQTEITATETYIFPFDKLNFIKTRLSKIHEIIEKVKNIT